MGKSVILIDDSKFILEILKTFFQEKLKFNVLSTGGDGNEAIILYRKYRPDLITLDMTMPNKDGVQALKEILSEFPDAKILIISAVKGEDMLRCLSEGACGYIEKPLKMQDQIFVADFIQTVNDIFK
jgi:two-component system chemotaxis response regulator CheY